MRPTIASLATLTALAAFAAAPGGAAATEISSCKYLANTACQYLPPTSVEDVCGIVDATTALTCEGTTTRKG